MLWVIIKNRLFKQSWLVTTRYGQGLRFSESVCNGLLVGQRRWHAEYEVLGSKPQSETFFIQWGHNF